MSANPDNPTPPTQVLAKRAGTPGAPASTQGMPNGSDTGAGRGELTHNRTLTRKQLAVLHVIMDPDNADKTDTEMMELAGVSRSTFYAVMRDPGVEAERQRMCKELIAKKVAPIIHSSIKTALTAGRDGFQDRRLLLSMSGDYVERQQLNHHHSGAVMVGVVGVSPDDL